MPVCREAAVTRTPEANLTTVLTVITGERLTGI
jgi:hypothetical protein